MRHREAGRVTVQPSGFPFIHPRLLLLLVDVAYSPCLCSPSFCARPFLIPRSFHNWPFLNSCSFYFFFLVLFGCPLMCMLTVNPIPYQYHTHTPYILVRDPTYILYCFCYNVISIYVCMRLRLIEETLLWPGYFAAMQNKTTNFEDSMGDTCTRHGAG
jgi:hypothetical protein